MTVPTLNSGMRKCITPPSDCCTPPLTSQLTPAFAMPGTGLLLARYNESMHLGQGFNSFLKVPCIENAVAFDHSKVAVERADAGSPAGVSQAVSYSSRFVKKISDVVQSMNISAASSIKSGSIEASSSGNPVVVEEEKFTSSDLNVMVSVKVIPIMILT